MGGKTKQSQRTKNNVRPSSSSRSAGLLNSGVNLEGGLVTLSSGKTVPQLFPTLAAVNLEQGLTPEFQMCIKKLNKKDPITRAKALQELCELVNSADVNDVVAALPSWAHFYKILSADADRKVRELTQVCQGAVVRVCGRRVAPQLKALLPAWLAAQHDPHAPAQAAAAHALKNTFPDNKLPEVISFCKVEVMAHLLDSLIGNAESVVTKRIEDAEERELQMNRIKTSSLQGLEYFVEHLPAAHDEWLWTELTPLLQAAAFWKLAQAAHQIRGAWYAAVGRMVSRYAATFGAAYGVRLLRLLLEGARDPAAACAPPLWGCLLQLMHHAQDWPAYLDKKELLVKRILEVLENGGWGDARHLSNMLLPLLAHLPQDLLTKEFYETFFKAVFSGLDKKNIINSKSERQAWITSLAECLRYLSIQEQSFVLEISTSVHRQWLERVLLTLQDGQTRTNLIKCSATNMTSLVKYWLKQSTEANNEKYDQLIRNFWQNIGSSVLTQIDKCSTDEKEIEKSIEGHILLLQTLKTAFTQDSKKQLNIKFDDDEPSQRPPPSPAPAPAPAPSPAAACDTALAARYSHCLHDCVHKICAHYAHTAQLTQLADPILTPLLTLLNDFDSENLFLAIARQFDVDSVYKLYEKVLRSWLISDSMCSKSVVDIVFLAMKYMTEEEQDAMFASFDQVSREALEWCVAVSARHPAVRGAAARRWLRGEAAGRAGAPGGARAAARPRPPPLLLCVASAPPLASPAAVARVLTTLSAALAPPHAATLDTAAALAARLVSDLHDHAHTEQYERLVLDLFQLNILVPRGDERLSVATWCEVRSSWQDGLAAMPRDARQRALQHAASFIHDQLFQDIKYLDINKIENVVSPCAELVWVGAGAEGAGRGRGAGEAGARRGGGRGRGGRAAPRVPERAAVLSAARRRAAGRRRAGRRRRRRPHRGRARALRARLPVPRHLFENALPPQDWLGRRRR
ncbi:unnamed protein product [Chrysodeixis includens]|uniref:E3 ubiquitin-protein ligase listerin n=1 Tax=Chrysodeixis includens TaxID=689277 RepID=A0A9N8L0C2_CHRIL|nr:unnamed protein product [Chrysodeixis includens]